MTSWTVWAKRTGLALIALVSLAAAAILWSDDTWSAKPSSYQPPTPTNSVEAIASASDLRQNLSQVDPGMLRLAAQFAPALLLVSVEPGQVLPGYEHGPTAYGLTPEAAALFNAALPVSHAPNPAATGFNLADASGVDRTRALDCLTAAVYYESATEPLEGQQAVAQVVLNRVRHPAYPKTVCGVVFQGSERVTGCQFSFTCDGALARAPNPVLWERSKKVAEAALSGAVAARVGHATHYHTFWVAPYWAPELAKIGRVGAHIFYRWPGAMGLPKAFMNGYLGGEWDPRLQDQPLMDLDTSAIQLVSYQPETLAESADGPASATDTASSASDDQPAATAEAAGSTIEFVQSPVSVALAEPPRPARPARLALPSATW